ncbi:MAG: ArsA family ATPase [Acidobacteriota bacterium]
MKKEKQKIRIILFTGKGGVGKTSVASATALRCSELGYRTLLMSTDAAHSLSDSFEMEIGKEIKGVGKNLMGVEIDVNYEIQKNWGPIKNFIHDFLKKRGLDDIIAEEMAVFPGMEEIFSLLELVQYYMKGQFDVIIIDCAPTGDTLRLLSVPDIAKWYMEKIFNIERMVLKGVRPIMKQFVDFPLPDDGVFASVEKLYRNLIGIKEVLTDPEISSVRMVVNPEKMVIKEAQRAYTFLNLFGFVTDAVIINRIITDEIQDSFYDRWKEIQKEHLKNIEENFSPIPIFKSKLWKEEVVGKDLLSQMASYIYQDKNPVEIFYKEKPIKVVELNGNHFLLIKMPFATKEVVDLWVNGDELTIKFKNFKRNLVLPRSLSFKKIEEATIKEGFLEIKFGGENYGEFS